MQGNTGIVAIFSLSSLPPRSSFLFVIVIKTIPSSAFLLCHKLYEALCLCTHYQYYLTKLHSSHTVTKLIQWWRPDHYTTYLRYNNQDCTTHTRFSWQPNLGQQKSTPKRFIVIHLVLHKSNLQLHIHISSATIFQKYKKFPSQITINVWNFL